METIQANASTPNIVWPTRPFDAEWTRKAILWAASKPPEEIVPKGLQGVITGALDKLYNEPGKKDGERKRHVVLGWIFGDPKHPMPLSSKSLTDSQWFALYRWVKPSRVVDEHNKIMWLPDNNWMTEALFCLAEALKAYRNYQQQMEMLAGMQEE